MTDRPILFSAPMIRALLDGRKTMTRRVIKPQPPKNEDFPGSYFALSRAVADGVKMYSQDDYERLPKHPTKWELIGSVGVARDAGFPNVYDVRYEVGDRLWVRETWQHARQRYCSCPQGSEPSPCDDWSDGTGCRSNRGEVDYRADSESFLHWLPSTHMPRWASRLTLIVETVKVERLRKISEEDARAEGVEQTGIETGAIQESGAPIENGSYRATFCDLWNSIHGPGAWDANPWVVALGFRVVRANIDAVKEAA